MHSVPQCLLSLTCTVRYESAENTAVFSDGSMEQDLPMQQLSEMFNVNHFIISQANRELILALSVSHFIAF